MKTCTRCKLQKPFAEFHSKSESKDGYQTKCKQCFKEINLRWYTKNKEKRLKTSKEWYDNNKDRKKETQKQWVQNNLEKYLAGCCVRRNRRRCRELNAEGNFSAKDVKRIYDMQRGKCAGCGVKLKKYHVDHIIPLALGGTNWANNLQILCVACNLSKYAKHPIDWANENGKLL